MHVDARIEHIDRYSEVGRALGYAELLDQIVGIVDGVVDYLGEFAGQMGIMGVKALQDKFGVTVVAGEDDRLAQPVAAGHPQACLLYTSRCV